MNKPSSKISIKMMQNLTDFIDRKAALDIKKAALQIDVVELPTQTCFSITSVRN